MSDDGKGELRATPWWVLSGAIHLLVIGVWLPLVRCQRPVIHPPIALDITLQPAEEVEEEPVEENMVVQPERIEPAVDPVDSDVMLDVDAEYDDHEHNEDEAKGASEVDVSERFHAQALGAGLDAGGPFGSRARSRRRQILHTVHG